MAPNLRPYQDHIINQCRALMAEGHHRVLLQSPTGSGKTLLTAFMIKAAAARGLSSWFCVHRRELVHQSSRTFYEQGIRHGVVSNGFLPEDRHAVQICSIQTLANRYHRLRRPQLIVWDECHHCAASSWKTIYTQLPDAFHIGLTATPERLDGQGLGAFFPKMINGPSVKWLIENQYLAPYKLYAPPGIDTTGIHTRMGDFARGELGAAVDKPTITGDAIEHYRRLSPGRRAVVFCVSVEHSKHVVSQFLAAGIPAEHVDGDSDKDYRDAALARFARGDTLVISNVDLFGEGFDLPALEVAILLRPTQSLCLYLQQVGRALRPYPGKTHALILDHAGNCQRHGLPDEERLWSLEGKKGRAAAENKDAPCRVCPRCYAAQPIGAQVCAECGMPFPVQSREVEHVDGELVEADLDAIRARRERMREQSSAETLQDLVNIGIKRKYKRPYLWAKHVMNARQARKLMGVNV